MKATDNELELALESCEQWGWACAGLLVLGLIAEFALALAHPEYDSFWGRWGPALGTLLVVVGVAGEVQFGKMGSRRQGELTQRAKKLLAEAQVETERIKARVADRRLTKEQFERVIESLKGREIEGGFMVSYPANDREACQYAGDIMLMLQLAGVTIASPEIPNVDSGLVLRSRERSNPNMAGKVIAEALLGAGIDLHWQVTDQAMGATLMVGAKPAAF